MWAFNSILDIQVVVEKSNSTIKVNFQFYFRYSSEWEKIVSEAISKYLSILF